MTKQCPKSNNQRRSLRRFRRFSFGDSFGFSYSDFEFLCRRHGFTILELLVVIAIIITLAGLILATTGYVQKKGARSRAEAEIAAMSAALESYRADNGIYPSGSDTNALDARTDGTAGATYQKASFVLYNSLSGATSGARTPASGAKSYFTFRPNMLSPADQTQNVTYIRDPFGNSYGYSTAYQSDVTNGTNPPSHGYNPTFDLWSTAGLTTNPQPSNDTITPQWIKNW
jgi:prepilin-type N-terminal cleavage/methylation domain-containing protein